MMLVQHVNQNQNSTSTLKQLQQRDLNCCRDSETSSWSAGRTGFKVVVDDGRSDLVEVLEGVDDLHDDGAALLL